jgi:hypothetical protein
LELILFYFDLPIGHGRGRHRRHPQDRLAEHITRA